MSPNNHEWSVAFWRRFDDAMPSRPGTCRIEDSAELCGMACGIVEDIDGAAVGALAAAVHGLRGQPIPPPCGRGADACRSCGVH